MEAKARQTDIKMTARKLRRVINEVRGKAVKDARVMLRFMPYFAARVVEKNLVAAIANNAEISKKDAEAAVSAVVSSISEALAGGEKVQLVGFGTFEVRDRAAKQGRNPRTGESITIPASKLPAFKAGSALKEAVSK